jgi:hypothetical protein
MPPIRALTLSTAHHPIHISKSAIAALTFPDAPAAIIWVVEMGAPHRLARNAVRASLSGGWRRSDLEKLPFGSFIMYHLRKSLNDY